MTDTTTAIEDAEAKPETKGLPAQRVEALLKCRAKRKALAVLFEQEDQDFKKLETSLIAWLQKYLIENGLENIRTGVGTVFLQTRTTASLSDPDAFMKFVIATGKFELLDRKANTTAVRDFLKETGNKPPGANLSSIQTLGVHKKVGGKLDD